MKDYTPGLLRHRCSNAMKTGKPIKIYENTPDEKPCPNCKEMVSVLITQQTEEYYSG